MYLYVKDGGTAFIASEELSEYKSAIVAGELRLFSIAGEVVKELVWADGDFIYLDVESS